MRAATAFTAFFIVTGSTGLAWAQYYPAPQGHPGYRQLPPVLAEDDEDLPPPRRGFQRQVPVYITPDGRPIPPGQVEGYPPGAYRGGPPMPAPEQEAYVPPPPAGFIYREAMPPLREGPPPGYRQQPPVAAQPYPAYPNQQQGYGAPPPGAPMPPPGAAAAMPPQGAPQGPQGEPLDGFRPPLPIGPPQQAAPGQPGAPQDVTGSTPRNLMASLGPDYQPETGPRKDLPPQFRRTIVDFRTKEPVGTIIVDTPSTYLYLVMPGGKAMRYGIGVGREGFTWTGVEKVTKMAEWPDWNPPPEMIERQPYLPRFMAGGETNPLGARALYLGKTIYRIHGTNQPSTIGSFVSSGCIRLTNEDVQDLYTRVKVGTRVVVLPGGKPPATASAAPQQYGPPQQGHITPGGPPVSVR